MSIAIKNYISNTLAPKVFRCVDTIFPVMEFKKVRGKWRSPYHIDGTASTSGKDYKSVITTKYPFRIINIDGDYYNGKKCIDLIELYQAKNNVSFVEALTALAEKSGTQAPPFSEEDKQKWEAHKAEQDKLSDIAQKMREALFLPEGKEVLAYLTAAKADGGRGYTEELIRDMELGCVTPELAQELRRLTNGGEWNALSSDIGKSHTLAVTLTERGNIVGYNFRSLDSRPDKYRALLKNGSAPFKELPFLKLTGDFEERYDLTIVEGEFDALHAQAVGIGNIAATGREIADKVEGLKRLKKYEGVRRVNILYDRGEKGTADKIETAIKAIKEAELVPYVLTLPVVLKADGKEAKMDLDEYLLSHSAEDFKREVFGVIQTANDYRIERLCEEAFDKDKFLDKIFEWYTEPQKETDRDELIKRAAYIAQKDGSQAWTEEALRKDLEAYRRKEGERKLKNELKEKVSTLRELADKGNLQEAAQFMEDESRRIKSSSVQTQVGNILRQQSKEEALSMLKEVPQQIETRYEFKDEGGKTTQTLSIPQGALTIVGAPTSHGKSTFLRNLALDIAEQIKDDEKILYFTFEEEKSAVLTQFINSYVNVTIHQSSSTHPQLQTIRNYFSSGNTQFFGEGKAEEFREGVDEYFEKVHSKIVISDEDLDANSLINALRVAVDEAKAKAIFIDYIQLMRKTGYKATRAEELKDICIELNTFAKDTKLPVILAAQLTRSITSPLGLVNTNLAESSDIEKAANTILLLWNGVERCSFGLSSSEEKAVAKLEERGGTGTHFGNGGFIYARLTKNRGGVKNLEAFLKFNGDTGRIRANRREQPKTEQPQQSKGYELPF